MSFLDLAAPSVLTIKDRICPFLLHRQWWSRVDERLFVNIGAAFSFATGAGDGIVVPSLVKSITCLLIAPSISGLFVRSGLTVSSTISMSIETCRISTAGPRTLKDVIGAIERLGLGGWAVELLSAAISETKDLGVRRLQVRFAIELLSVLEANSEQAQHLISAVDISDLCSTEVFPTEWQAHGMLKKMLLSVAIRHDRLIDDLLKKAIQFASDAGEMLAISVLYGIIDYFCADIKDARGLSVMKHVSSSAELLQSFACAATLSAEKTVAFYRLLSNRLDRWHQPFLSQYCEFSLAEIMSMCGVDPNYVPFEFEGFLGLVDKERDDLLTLYKDFVSRQIARIENRRKEERSQAVLVEAELISFFV